MSDITKKSLTEIIRLIKKKEIKSVEVTTSFIDNIKNDKKLNSFITNCNEQALEKAKSFDKNPKLDQLLPGVPIAVKDLFCTNGTKTTAGSKMLENFIPNYESTITNYYYPRGQMGNLSSRCRLHSKIYFSRWDATKSSCTSIRS